MPGPCSPVDARPLRPALWGAVAALSLGAGTLGGTMLGLRAAHRASPPPYATAHAPVAATPLYDAAHPAPSLARIPTGRGLFAEGH